MGSTIDVDEMLYHFQHDEDPIESVLKRNHFLIGILHANQETIDLRNLYEKERVNILRKFNDKDLLEMVINEWE